MFGKDSGMSEGSQGPAALCVCGSQRNLACTGRVRTAVLSGVNPESGICSQMTGGWGALSSACVTFRLGLGG